MVCAVEARTRETYTPPPLPFLLCNHLDLPRSVLRKMLLLLLLLLAVMAVVAMMQIMRSQDIIQVFNTLMTVTTSMLRALLTR